MYTIIETPTFTRLWPDYWTEDERGEFVAWLALHPEVGDVIKSSGGCRKVRWSRPGTGKRGGVRVIHYNRLTDGVIYLLRDVRQRCEGFYSSEDAKHDSGDDRWLS